ncbi:MAG: hypothetical protein R2744_01510 [Bacteroidales bacterium]
MEKLAPALLFLLIAVETAEARTISVSDKTGFDENIPSLIDSSISGWRIS